MIGNAESSSLRFKPSDGREGVLDKADPRPAARNESGLRYTGRRAATVGRGRRSRVMTRSGIPWFHSGFARAINDIVLLDPMAIAMTNATLHGEPDVLKRDSAVSRDTSGAQ